MREGKGGDDGGDNHEGCAGVRRWVAATAVEGAHTEKRVGLRGNLGAQTGGCWAVQSAPKPQVLSSWVEGIGRSVPYKVVKGFYGRVKTS